MSQGIEFNRLMLDMRAMQMDAMAQPKSVAVPPVSYTHLTLPTIYSV